MSATTDQPETNESPKTNASQAHETSSRSSLATTGGVVVAIIVVVALLGAAGLDTVGVLVDALRSGLGVQGAVFALAAVGLNLNYGYTGLLNFGPVAFLAAASYGLGITITSGGSFWLGILVGMGAAAVLALLLGLPTLRLRGDFLAITTIAAGEVLRVALRSDNFFSMLIILVVVVGVTGLLTWGLPKVSESRVAQLGAAGLAVLVLALVSRWIWQAQIWFGRTGGPFGVPRPDEPSIVDTFYGLNPVPPGTYFLADVPVIGSILSAIPWVGDFAERIGYNDRQLWVILVTWTLVAITSALVWRLVNSPWGRVLRAIREDEDAARAVGKNAFSYKLQSLLIGGVIMGLAGIARAMDQAFFNPTSFFTQTTFFIWTVLILGGAATIRGPIIGAIVFWSAVQFLEGLLGQMVERDWIPEAILDANEVSSVRFILLGVTLAALMIWRPQGILGKKEEALLDAA